jgi:hypothetical protein
MRVVFALVAVVAGLIVCGPAPVRSDEKADEAADNAIADKLPPATTASLRRLLFERIEIPDRFRSQPVPLKDVTKFIVHEALRRKEFLPVTYDQEAFKDAVPDLVDVWEVPVPFPKHLRTMTYRQVFELCASQLPAAGTYIIRDGEVIFWPGEYKIQQLLRSKIAVEFHGKPLVPAIEEICDRSGLSIAVDPRCDDGNKKTVTLQVDGGMSVRDILDSLADVHDLKVIVTSGRVTIVPQAAYMSRLREQVESEKLERQLGHEPSVEELLKKAFGTSPNPR